MSKRQEPGAKVVEFFQNAPQDTAELLLKICADIVRRRASPAKVKGKPRATPFVAPSSTAEVSGRGKQSDG